MLFFLYLFSQTMVEPWSEHVVSNQIISFAHFARSPTGSVFFLNKTDGLLCSLNSDGVLNHSIRVLGQGPGENQWPGYIQVVGDSLYLQGRYHINIFEFDLTFAAKITTPEYVNGLKKLTDGWVGYREAILAGGDREPLSLYWFSDDFSRRELIKQWPKQVMRSNGKAGNLHVVNPVEDLTMCGVDREGARFAFFKPSYVDQVYVYDAREHQIIREIAIKGTPIPHNPKLDEYLSKGYRDGKQKWPDVLPLVYNMVVSARNKLVLSTWRQILTDYRQWESELNLSEMEHFRRLTSHLEKGGPYVFSPLGEKLEPGVMENNTGRILWLAGDFAFVRMYNAERDYYYVSRCAVSDLDVFLNDNPEIR